MKAAAKTLHLLLTLAVMVILQTPAAIAGFVWEHLVTGFSWGQDWALRNAERAEKTLDEVNAWTEEMEKRNAP